MNVTLQEFLDALWHYDKSILIIKDQYLDAIDEGIRNGFRFSDFWDYPEFALDWKYNSMQPRFYLHEKWANGKVVAFNVFDEGMMVFVEYEKENIDVSDS